jgi:hypothetical protein
LAGIKALEKSCSYVLKIRSDFAFEFEPLKEFLSSDIKEESIYVPYFDPKNPNFINDFYFFGKCMNLKQMLLGLLPDYSLMENIHYDIFYTYLKVKSTKHPLVKKLSRISLFILRINSHFNSVFIRYCWANLFQPLPRDFYLTSNWRGYLLSHDKNAKRYRFREHNMNEFSVGSIQTFQLNKHLGRILRNKFAPNLK